MGTFVFQRIFAHLRHPWPFPIRLHCLLPMATTIQWMHPSDPARSTAVSDDFIRLLQVPVQFRLYLRSFPTGGIPAPLEH